MNYSSTTSQILRAAVIGITFVVPYIFLNTLMINMFPEMAYYLHNQVLLIPYLAIFFGLLTYRLTRNTSAATSAAITNLIIGSIIFGLYIYFPHYYGQVKTLFSFLLPVYAIYTYFSLENSF